MTTERFIDEFAKSLFEHDLEIYNSEQKDDPVTKGLSNLGGAKIFAQLDFRSPKTPLVIKHSGFKQALLDSRSIVHTVNRVQLDEYGEPVKTKSGTGFNRTHTGLMLYCEFDQDPEEPHNVMKLLQESIKVDLSNYMDVVTNIPTIKDKLHLFTQLKHQNFLGELVPLKPSHCILLAVRSGPMEGNSLWTFDNVRIKNRQAMSDSLTASPAELDNLPF